MGTNIKRPALLVLIRHGQSERNVAKKDGVYFADDAARNVIAGTPDQDVPLTDEGKRQARETGKALRERFGVPDYFYHSGYARTIQTTGEILKAYSPREFELIRVRKNTFIRERDPGYTYDMTRNEAETQFPWMQEYWDTFGNFFARPIGGESLADVAERIYLFLNMLFRDRAGKKIFVASHGHAIRCFRYLLERQTERGMVEEPNSANCGVTVYQYDEAKKHLVFREFSTIYWK